jgi:hypothetical protein
VFQSPYIRLIMTSLLSSFPTAALMAELQRRLKCAEAPEKRTILIGKSRSKTKGSTCLLSTV